MFLNKNPIKTYQNSIGGFTAFDLTPDINNTNIQRLSINIFYEYILNNKFLLEITPNLIQPQSYISEKIELKINPPEQIYNIKTLNSITIDEEDLMDRSGLVLINKKYYGLPISMKFEFENMAILSNILDPSAVFLKTRNFYLW